MKQSLISINISLKNKTGFSQIFTCCIALSSTTHVVAQAGDTLYLNNNWQICDRPFATYYRVANINSSNSTFNYAGEVKDYFIDGKPEMEGTYSEKGVKQGPFRFYYQNGKLKAEGTYENNNIHGDWTYYYNNGNKKAVIEHNGRNGRFLVKECYDSSGKPSIKNGTGSFDLIFFDNISYNNFKIKGQMANGKRVGIWRYYNLFFPKRPFYLFKEVYVDNKLKRTTIFNSRGAVLQKYFDEAPTVHVYDFEKFRTVDVFNLDVVSFPFENRIPQDDALLHYALKRVTPVIDADNVPMENSFNIILKKLNDKTFIQQYFDSEKNYEGKIEFSLSDSGTVKELNVEGNLTNAEKNRIVGLMKKFVRIKPLQIDNKIARYSTIYFYTVDSKEMLPNKYRNIVMFRNLSFTLMPYEKMVRKINDDVKLRIETLEKFQRHIISNVRWQIDPY